MSYRNHGGRSIHWFNLCGDHLNNSRSQGMIAGSIANHHCSARARQNLRHQDCIGESHSLLKCIHFAGPKLNRSSMIQYIPSEFSSSTWPLWLCGFVHLCFVVFEIWNDMITKSSKWLCPQDGAVLAHLGDSGYFWRVKTLTNDLVKQEDPPSPKTYHFYGCKMITVKWYKPMKKWVVDYCFANIS